MYRNPHGNRIPAVLKARTKTGFLGSGGSRRARALHGFQEEVEDHGVTRRTSGFRLKPRTVVADDLGNRARATSEFGPAV